MHLCIAASLDPLCWAVCWAVACQVKTATENPNAAAMKSLFALLMTISRADTRVYTPAGQVAVIVCPPPDTGHQGFTG